MALHVSQIYRFLTFLNKYLKLLWNNKKSRVGMIIIIFFVIMGFIGPYFIPNPITHANPVNAFSPPQLTNFYYILGTGPIGESILGNIVWGAKQIIIVSFLAGMFATLIGIIVGIVAGYFGGIVDTVLMAINDIIMTIPSIVLLIILVNLYKTDNPFIIAFILSVTAWPGLARAIRSQVLMLKAMPYIEITKTLGLGSFHTIFRELLPNLGSYIAINFMFQVEGAVYGIAGLYYLGDMPIDFNNWGYLISQALGFGSLYSARELSFILSPSIAITLYMLGFILFSYGLDEITNPRLRVKI